MSLGGGEPPHSAFKSGLDSDPDQDQTQIQSLVVWTQTKTLNFLPILTLVET